MNELECGRQVVYYLPILWSSEYVCLAYVSSREGLNSEKNSIA